jgi:hypothetical protein
VIAAFACLALVGGVGTPLAGAATYFYNSNNSVKTIAPTPH